MTGPDWSSIGSLSVITIMMIPRNNERIPDGRVMAVTGASTALHCRVMRILLADLQRERG
jgi:hypothetical protein